jgi:hypothetical protein
VPTDIVGLGEKTLASTPRQRETRFVTQIDAGETLSQRGRLFRLCADDPARQVVDSATEKETDRQSPPRLSLKFWNEIGRADVQRHAGSERESVFAE